MRTLCTSLNVFAWTSLAFLTSFLWCLVTHHIELPGEDYLQAITLATQPALPVHKKH